MEINCDKIACLAQSIEGKRPIDTYQEISPGGQAVIMTADRQTKEALPQGKKLSDYIVSVNITAIKINS